MSTHEQEHRLYPIPPYAWHYKCAIEGCDYETDSFQSPKQACSNCAVKDARAAALTKELTDTLAELHFHFGCDPKCEERHADLATYRTLVEVAKPTCGESPRTGSPRSDSLTP